jgi:preprotein translocase SecE subunit
MKRSLRAGKTQTLRQKASKAIEGSASGKSSLVKRAVKGGGSKLATARAALGRSYTIGNPVADDAEPTFLTRQRKVSPAYVRNSWKELGLVTWPGHKVTWKLVGAVLVFATLLGIAVSAVDAGLSWVFKQIIL